jgi:GNAT superfamily N-acetyltransferase
MTVAPNPSSLDSNSMKASITLTPVAAEVTEALVELRIAAMRESLERIGRFGPVRVRERILPGFSPDQTRRIELEGKRIGFVVVKIQFDHMLLNHLYIHPTKQGNSVGAAVIAQVIQDAEALGLPIRVGALRESDANRLDERHGFKLTEQTDFDNYYFRAAENAR